MRTRTFSLAVLALLATTSIGLAQPAAKLPDGLRHVPPDAMGFIHLRTGDFLKSELGQQLIRELQQDKEAKKGLQQIEKEIGITLADMDTITLLMLQPPTYRELEMMERGGGRWMPHRKPGYSEKAMPPFPVPEKEAPKEDKKAPDVKEGATESPVLFQEFPEGGKRFDTEYYERINTPMMGEYMAMSGPLVIVSSTKPLDRKSVLRKKLFDLRPNDPYGPPREQSSLFLTDRTIMIGAPWELARYSEQIARNPAPKAKPLASAFALAEKPHTVIAGGHIPLDVRRMMRAPFGPDAQFFAMISPLLQTEAALAVNLGKSLDLTIQLESPNETSAENTLQAVKTLKSLGELALEKMNEEAEPAGWKLTLEKRLKETLASTVIEQKGTTVSAKLKMELDPVLVKRYMKELVSTVRGRGDRTQSLNNLKNIALSMHSYHDANKRMPPAGVSSINDPQGKPILSWRVAMLPYLDQQELYQKFDLTQPWDHPTNKKLIPLMPQVYVVPGAPEHKDPGMTHYRVLVGPTTMFEPGQRITLVTVTDGTSNTIMVVEAADPTVWTRPDDLPFNPQGPLPKFGVSTDGFNAAFGDGTVRFIRSNTPDNVIRALITRNGGEAVALPEDR